MLHAATPLIPNGFTTPTRYSTSVDIHPIPKRRKSKLRNGYHNTMPADSQKIQIGIRLPAALVQRIDAGRQNKTRAEYCRDLIEAGLVATEHGADGLNEILVQSLDSLQKQILETRQSAILSERVGGKSLAEIKSLRDDLATLMVGVLTKIGQAVREEDQRQFAREKAEAFVKRVIVPTDSSDGDEP